MGAFLRSKSLLSVLVIVCTSLFLLMLLMPLADYLFALSSGTLKFACFQWLALSSEPSALLSRPWTLVTYLFLHEGLWHWLFSMMMLYVAGTMCCRYLGEKRFAWLFFLCGVVGALFFLLVFNWFPVSEQQAPFHVAGAMSAALGVFVAVAVYAPNQEIGLWFFRTFSVKMKWLAVAFVVIDLLFIKGANAGGHIAHLGGMLCGWVYVVFVRYREANPRTAKKKAPRMRVKHTANRQQADTQARNMSDGDYNRRKANDQKRVDAILDKISKSGYDNLSREDKEFLFKYKP